MTMTNVSGRMAPIVSAPTRGLLPEHVNYRDTGCDVSPSCLQCPLPVCRYDKSPVYGRTPVTILRHVRIIQHRSSGRSFRQIAVLEGVSVRTVTSVLRSVREAAAA